LTGGACSLDLRERRHKLLTFTLEVGDHAPISFDGVDRVDPALDMALVRGTLPELRGGGELAVELGLRPGAAVIARDR